MKSTNLIDLFFTLVKIDSETGEEKNIAKYLFYYLKRQKISTQMDKFGNVYASLPGKGEPIFFAAHLDTVAPGKGIKPAIKNGFVVSDGTTILGADNKVAIACILNTIIQLKKVPHSPLEIIFTLSEEIGNYGAINFDFNLLKSKIGFCFDYPSPVGTIVNASPFYERFDLQIIGKEAHASKPETAINVLPIFNQLLNITKLGKVDDDSLLNFGVFKGGFVRNTIPGSMLIQGEIRSFVEKILLHHKKQLLNNIKQVANKYKSKYKIDFVRENGGYKHSGPTAEKYISHVQKSLREINITPKVIPAWGVSDANIFNNRNLLCLNLGDGCENTHTLKERVKILQMEKLIKVMLKLSHAHSRHHPSGKN